MTDPHNNSDKLAFLQGEFQKVFSSENPVFSGGFGLALLAAGAQLLRSSSTIGIRLLRQHCLVTMEVTSKDRAYPWVLRWLTTQNNRTRHLSVETALTATNQNSTKSHVKFNLVPGPGQHFLLYHGQILLAQRIREQQMLDLNSGKPWEKVLFTAIGRNPTVFSHLLDDAYALSSQQEENKTIIFTNWGSEWRQFGQPRRKRSIESVILDQGLADHILSDVFDWLASSKWYNDRGIPYRRGYLLHGPPGSGKSSFIYALAGKLDMNICILNLSERGLTDDRLALALSTVPSHSIILLEDVDAAFPSRTEANTAAVHTGSEVTFSGLLNVLDGVSASEDRLIFMTTNHIERLDAALIRPGRVDYVQLIDDATDYQIDELHKRFYPEASAEERHDFVLAVRGVTKTISMAALQGYLLRFKGQPHQARENMHTLLMHLPSMKKNAQQEDKDQPVVKGNVKPRPVRKLSVEEVDRMYFNPQEGWDKNI
eukprot:gene9710-10740_t